MIWDIFWSIVLLPVALVFAFGAFLATIFLIGVTGAALHALFERWGRWK